MSWGFSTAPTARDQALAALDAVPKPDTATTEQFAAAKAGARTLVGSVGADWSTVSFYIGGHVANGPGDRVTLTINRHTD